MIALGNMTSVVVGIMMLFIVSMIVVKTDAFTIRPLLFVPIKTTTTTTTTFQQRLQQQQQQQHPLLSLYMIDKNIANMIDDEYYRQHHKKEYHLQWMEQNQSQIKQTAMMMDTYNADTDNDLLLNRKQLLRDIKLAKTNPQQYCLDRCIATGYCDVYEDYFDFTPEEVMTFCNDCVLALDDSTEKECNIPDAFYENQIILNNNDNNNTPPSSSSSTNTFSP